MNTQKTLLSFIIGAAAGVAAGMLMAPTTGADTRKKIVDKANTLKNDLGGQLEETLNKFSELTDSALATISSYANKAETAAKQGTAGNQSNPSGTPNKPGGQL
jgi:gas vesicle protein